MCGRPDMQIVNVQYRISELIHSFEMAKTHILATHLDL